MRRLSLAGQRKLFGFGMTGVAALVIYWSYFTDGLPIFWGPSARAAEIAAGRELFEHEWTANDPLAHGDGLGPVFNARSCGTCHVQGGLGGGGGLEHNAVSYEVLPRPGDLTFRNGNLHNFSVDPSQKESLATLRSMFPVIKGSTTRAGDPHCSSTVTIPDFDPVHTQSVQTTALFGAGWIDLISDKAIIRNARTRGVREVVQELGLKFDTIPVGRVRHVSGGVGKFGWKGQFASLSDFVAAACANELGLGTPTVEQAKPLAAPGSSSPPDLDKKQFRALMAFVKTLPRPVEATPEQPADQDTVAHGKAVFGTIGCAVCHVPDLGGVKGVYSDFLLYTLEEVPPPGGGGGGGGGYGPEPPPQLQLPSRPDSEPKPAEWKTAALWGVADSAPYMHDGSAPTLQAAIQKHRGDARVVSEKFKALPPHSQAAVIAFLNTLKAPPDAPKVGSPEAIRVAQK